MSRSGRPSADERLRRLLALVPWVAAHDGPTVAEVCARFDLTEAELVDDLELLFLCGLHPYTPDMLIEADVSDGRVWIRYAEYFERPLRLTAAEALALVAAGRTLLAAPGADPGGPLARGLAKLAAVLGVDPDQAVEVDPGDAAADVLAVLRAAVGDRRPVELDYYSFGRDEWTRRVVEPSSVFSSAGQWYVSAWCRLVDDERLFRVDRIRSATALDEVFAPRREGGELAVFTPRAGDPRVELELTPAGRWVAGQYPVEAVTERRGGGLRVRLAVSEPAWLERLLLRLGPDARVVKGDAGLAGQAARRVLARYR
jgi:proteasome accessory factor C